MKEKLKHYAKEILFFLATMALVLNIASYYKSRDLNGVDFNLTHIRLIDNSFYNNNASKPKLVHFWATWCPTCKLEADNIERLSKEYEVITIAVNSGSDYDIKQYLDEHNLHFRVINDKKGTLSKYFNVTAFPTTFIYDKNNKLHFSEVGYSSTFGLWIRLLLADL